MSAIGTSVPMIWNASTLSKATCDAVSLKVQNASSKFLTQKGSEAIGKLSGGKAGALVGSGVKCAENWAREQDKNNVK